jgi:hypothetical protein
MVLDQPPVPTIDSAPVVLSSSADASFAFSDTQPDVTFSCQLDGGGFTACSSPQPFPGLGDGSHTFDVKAVDLVATESDVASWTWTVDATPPPPPTIDSKPALITNSTSASFAFSDTEPGVAFFCQRDGGGFASCSSPQEYPVGEGAHTFEVKAADQINESTPSSYGWTVDITAPGAPSIDSGPSGFVASDAPSFTFSEPDAADFVCWLDADEGASECSGSASYSGVPDGSHTFGVRAVDTAGNLGPASTRQWAVDTTAPTTTITEGPPTVTSGGGTFTFTGDDAGAGVTGYECRLDAEAFGDCTSPKAYTGLGNGSHTFYVRALDGAGNVDPTPASYTWTVDVVSPVVTLTEKPPLVTNSASATFGFVSDKVNSSYDCSLDGAPFAACTSPRAYPGLTEGAHTFSVRATWLGLQGSTVSYAWRVDTVPPETTIASGPPAASHEAAAAFAFSSSEAQSTFTCRLDSAGFVPCTSPKTYSGLGDGTHTFAVQAVDAAGNADLSPVAYTWQISGVGPPIADLKPPANVTKLRRNIGYGRLQLRWTKPRDSDFDHVNVYVSTSSKTPPRKLVYGGKRQSYTDRHFKNGQYYRYLVVSYDRAGNAAGGRPALVPASALLRSPRNGAVVRGAPTFRWAGVRGASFYNIQLYYSGSKVLSAWPHKPSQALTRRWRYGGHRFSLARGIYVWYVWPGFGSRVKGHYGQLLGQGSFRVR